MTNKTITLACPFCGSKELKQVTDDGVHFTQCKSCEATGPTGFKRGEDDAIDWNTRAALADPVPPAGGDVEVPGYSVKGNRYAIRLAKAELLDLYEGYTGDALVELVDRAHVTRLQAEVERLHGRVREEQTYVSELAAEHTALQSELTKARELLTERDALLNDFCAHSALICGDLLRLAREDDCATTDPIIVRAYSAMDHSRKVKKILSAPADKGHGQGDPVAWAMKPGLDRISVNPKASHAVFGHSGEPGWDVPLYAEPPAPVAVVMPSRDNLRDIIAQAIGGDTYDCTRVWSAWGVGTMSEDDFVPVVDQESRLYEMADACLDEFARLNPTKQ